MEYRFRFLRYRFISYFVSLLLVLGSLFLLYYKGLNLGLDFTGGRVIELRFEKKPGTGDLRRAIKEAGIESFLVQETKEGTYIVKVREGESYQAVKDAVKKFGKYELVREERIGGVISEELREKAVLAILTALGGILLYLAFRFQPVWGVGALLALVHDVLIVLGAYSLTYREVNLEVVSALLIVAGYSVADTVVIFDRIRENLRLRKTLPLEEVMDISINQTLSRTIMTSLTTFVTAFTLFILGGYALSNIMFAFVVGVVVGTFSSVFVASSFVLDMGRFIRLRREESQEETA
ncbi:preprotein translocase subunit SecF [Hydrogenivirga caldilitoris]|uniref:Protein-export membrane protein SecF n=1 Tax=Hydrogenivirga caldilitoris TaxID=246264 RepID=A0A497XPJ6_9AQUI|nr:protein translocase subunit SecF [Hydrogenivirga caldilitoris]RLJ70887.1 preprotein translocase subunit SecF [Hydrogenivirga caldilitoris]